MTAAPIVKFVGGKTKLLPKLLARAPQKFGRYFEPFVGGGALFFRLAPERAVIGDANEDLITTYRAVAEDVDLVIAALGYHHERHLVDPEGHYYDTRARWNTTSWTQPAARGAALIYMNRVCFNGLWRVNQAGEFNVPVGRYVRPRILDAVGLRAASVALRRATIIGGDYRATVADAEGGDFCYFDSPYVPLSASSNFTAYTADGFGVVEQAQLAETARKLAARGVHVMLSNSDTPLVRALYRGFQISRVRAPRAINCNAARRGHVNELIITCPALPRRRRTARAA